MNLYIWAWHPHCPPALALAHAIPNAWVIKHENSKYRYKPDDDIILNWGSSKEPPHPISLNPHYAVARAVNKVETFRYLGKAGVPHPRWDVLRRVAIQWDTRYLGRDSYTGRGGEGITVYGAGEVPKRDHKYYVKYFVKTREFRIHVLNGEVFWVQEKKRKNGFDDADKYVRSHDRGWCFAFKHLDKDPCPELVKTTAVQAVKALGLDFGAVDIGWNKDGTVCVFEVNTAPGIENSTLDAYAKAFGALL